MALCLCEFCIHAGVRLSMCVPVHVYSSLPLERFVQVGACTIGAWLSACVISAFTQVCN